jgi:hypothetical protein
MQKSDQDTINTINKTNDPLLTTSYTENRKSVKLAGCPESGHLLEE